MKIRKILAAVAASAVAVSAMATNAFAFGAFNNLNEFDAVLGFGDADWKAAGWGKGDGELAASYFTTANITADGTYTVAVDLSAGYTADGHVDEETGDPIVYTTANGIGAMGINFAVDASGETYDNVYFKVTSVKFDGVETIKSDVVSYTNNEDGGRRTNVMNAWANFDATKADHCTSDPDKASPVLTDFTGEWTKCEVTFEVTGMPAVGGSDTGAEDKGENNPDTGVEGIAVVAGLAIVATGAIVVAKKRS